MCPVYSVTHVPGCTRQLFIRAFQDNTRVPWEYSDDACDNLAVPVERSIQKTRSMIDFPNGGLTWTLDYTQVGLHDFRTTLLHELGHTVGFPDFDVATWPDFHENSIMHYWGTMNYSVWHWDIKEMVRQSWVGGCRPPENGGYLPRNSYRIRQYKSTNCGSTWYQVSDDLNETTNLPVGVAWRDSSYQYPLLAWVGTNGDHTINTIKGNQAGTSWSSKITHWGSSSETGVSVAGGGGWYVIAWAGKDIDFARRGRQIHYKTSTNGTSWNGPYTFQYLPQGQPEQEYGALSNVSVTYDAASNRFLLAFVNWNTTPEDSWDLGTVRICSSTTPGDPGAGFSHCNDTGQHSFGPVGIAADANGIFHILSVLHTGNPTYYLTSACGGLWFTGEPLVLTDWDLQGSSFTSHSDLSTFHLGSSCSNHFGIAFRGRDDLTKVNFAKKQAQCGSPTMFGKVTLSPTIKTGPTLVRSLQDNSLRVFVVGEL